MTTLITLKINSKVICSSSVVTDFIVLLAGWSTTKNSDAALFEVCLRCGLRGEQETVNREKPVLSVCRYQPARGPERIDTWGQLICYTECFGRLTPWPLDSTTLASSLLPDSQGLGLKHASHSIQLDLLCLSWDFLAAIINPLINPHLLCLHTYSFVSMEAPDFHTFLSFWLIVYLLLNATVIPFSDNSKVFVFILKQAFVIKNIENASKRRNIGVWKMA